MRSITIRYTKHQVALMVRIIALDDAAALARATHTTISDLRLIAAGRLRPTSGVLQVLDLQRNGRGYLWNVR